MFHKFDLGGVTHELWLAPTVHGYYLRIVDGWSGPVAFAEEGTGRGSLTVAGTSEAGRIRGRRRRDPYPHARPDAFATICRSAPRSCLRRW